MTFLSVVRSNKNRRLRINCKSDFEIDFEITNEQTFLENN